MEKLDNNNKENLKLPRDVPKGFFDIVSKLLNFVETVDKVKNDKN